jgi:hypothetical protein
VGHWALVPGVIMAQMLQHSYHAYLYDLRTENKGYRLPSHPLFPNLLCPHYTCEVAIYALLSLIAAPEGRTVNWTLVCGAIFVATNLGVTAVGTKAWYMEKFGAQKATWNMVGSLILVGFGMATILIKALLQVPSAFAFKSVSLSVSFCFQDSC